MPFVRAIGWFTYRRLRLALFSLRGKNRLGRGHALSAQKEWHSVHGLTRSLAVRPSVIRQTGGCQVWDTSMGEIMTPPGAGADYIGRLVAEMPSSVYALSPGDKVILDAGANIGIFSLYALQSGAERVICVEPSPGNVACIENNLKEFLQAKRAQIIPKGVWSHETVLRFNTGNQNNPGGHHIDDSGNLEVPVTSIDQIVEQLQLDRLDYIKMDVEGSELKAIEGATETLRRFRPRLCVATEHTADLYANAEAVIQALGRHGYDYTCTENHPYNSPSRGLQLTPYCVLFTPLPLAASTRV
jgi:FkbM family methyltransferase